MRKLLRLLFIEPFIIFFKILKLPFSIFKYFNKSIQEQEKKIIEIDSKVENMLRNGQRIPSSYWNIVSGNPKYQSGSELYNLFILIESKWQKEKEDASNKEKEEKKLKLVDKYGESNALKIIKKQLWVGMELKHIYEIKGKHEYKVDNVVNKVEQTILYYDKHKNRLGNDAYDFEITLESGKAVGWKNRANVATRNL